MEGLPAFKLKKINAFQAEAAKASSSTSWPSRQNAQGREAARAAQDLLSGSAAGTLLSQESCVWQTGISPTSELTPWLSPMSQTPHRVVPGVLAHRGLDKDACIFTLSSLMRSESTAAVLNRQPLASDGRDYVDVRAGRRLYSPADERAWPMMQKVKAAPLQHAARSMRRWFRHHRCLPAVLAGTFTLARYALPPRLVHAMSNRTVQPVANTGIAALVSFPVVEAICSKDVREFPKHQGPLVVQKGLINQAYSVLIGVQ
jgi:hypothetical protein